MEPDDPERFNVYRAASAGLPIFLECHRQQRPIGSGFDPYAAAQKKDPWKSQSPFPLQPAHSAQIIECRMDGYACSTVDEQVQRQLLAVEDDEQDLSAAVGNRFAQVSVKQKFSKHLQSMSNASRVTQRSSYRRGNLRWRENPSLSEDAKAVLRGVNGRDRFTATYGHYFVAGFVLGCDAAACVMVSNSSLRRSESSSRTEQLDLLWTKGSRVSNTTTLHEVSDLDMMFAGFDTLDNSNVLHRTLPGESTLPIKAAVDSGLAKLDALPRRLDHQLNSLRLVHGEYVSTVQCLEAVRSGVVIELALLPYSVLGEFVALETVT